jgi:histone H3/H4
MSKHCNRSCGSETQLHQVSREKSWDRTENSLSDRSFADPGAGSIVGRQVAADHESEWQMSGVDPLITRLNVQTLTSTQVDTHSREMIYPIAERLNWRVTRAGQNQQLRGWWVNGVDPLNDWQAMSWGRFKPDAATPVFDREKGKPAKYLSPAMGKGSSRLVLLDVPLRIWQAIADRYGMTISRQAMRQGFWHWVWQSGVPIVITEGEKKAGCLLTAGYAAIALPGIFGGYRREGNQLIAELAFFATAARQFHICFDYETKPLVAHNVFLATCRLGQLLTRSGCNVRVMTLPGPEKGVDDLITAHGVAEFNQLYAAAEDWSLWQTAKLWALTHPITVELDQPYLGDLDYPETGLAFVKSPKGTGKTTALKGVVQRAIAADRKVLVITHRIQLGRAICQSIGISWVSDRNNAARSEASEAQDANGLGLCIDSLHGNSQAKFDPTAWDGAVVILDEVEQVLWHAMNSGTCYNSRVRILATLKELVQHVLRTGGLILAQDADLSDISINYLKQLAGNPIDAFDWDTPTMTATVVPWIAVNRCGQQTHHAVSLYDTKTPAAILAKLPSLLAQGAVFIALDSQKVQGRWSSKNLETYLRHEFPQKRILRIDSETVADADHDAFGIAYRIDAIVANYDIILATPTIGTGVSIDIKGHFAAVLGIFQGAIADTEARQALARVRETVPRYVWAAKYGPGKIGNGSCFYQDLARSTAKAVKYNIMLLREVDFDLDQQTDPIALRTWAKMAARVNLSLWQFRDAFRNGLRRDGQTLTVVTDDYVKLFGVATPTTEQQQCLLAGDLTIPGYEYLAIDHDLATIERIQKLITDVRSRNQQAAAEAIVNSIEPDFEEISATAAATPPDRKRKTTQQRNVQRKQELQQRYAVELTSELALKDERGWYQQLLLHYYVTHDPLFVKLRDLQEWQNHLERGMGKVALQDVHLFTAQVEMLKAMGVLALLDVDRKTRATDEIIQRIAKLGWDYRQDIRTLFNIRITEKTPPMTFVQGLIAKMDVKLTAVSRDRMADGRRGGQRVYRYMPPTDDRPSIFAQWLERDQQLVAAAKSVQRKQVLLMRSAARSA